MCGLLAYCGKDSTFTFIKKALPKLEYRGYDSWGLAIQNNLGNVTREVGLGAPSTGMKNDVEGNIGIAHTRWATHGKVSIENCHPISDQFEQVYIAHNGIIDNFDILKDKLSKYDFKTETDTEVIANLFNDLYSPKKHIDDLLSEIKDNLKGEYSFIGISKYYKDLVFFISNGSPLLITEDGYVASDASAFSHLPLSKCYKLNKGEMGVISLEHGIRIFNSVEDWSWTPKDGIMEEIEIPKEEVLDYESEYDHYMLGEICCSPERIPKVNLWCDNLWNKKFTNVVLFGCGSSYNAALFGRSWFESAGLLTHIEYSTEFCNRPLHLYPKDTLFIAITQSGETKDTLLAIEKIIKNRGNSYLVVITNTESSSAQNLTNNNINLNCGTEFGVAATKTFTSTCCALIKFGCSLWTKSDTERNELDVYINETLCTAINYFICKEILHINYLSKQIANYKTILFLGRGNSYSVAREGALKLKEVSGIHCEAIPAAEMKHGPIALINQDTLSVFLALSDEKEDKILSNANEIKARGGRILTITDTKTTEKFKSVSNFNIEVPFVNEVMQPIVANVALQLLAYYTAITKGLNPDKPKNLAKSITVE